MVTISQRHHRFDAKIRIPKELQNEYGGKQQLEKRLASRDLRAAKAEGQLWEASLRIKWRLREDDPTLTKGQLREEYERQLADAGSHEAHGYYGEKDPVVGGIDFQIDQLADEVGNEEDMLPLQEAKLAALQDARKEAKGLPVAPRPQFEPSVSDTAERFMKWWKAQKGLASNDYPTLRMKREKDRPAKSTWVRFYPAIDLPSHIELWHKAAETFAVDLTFARTAVEDLHAAIAPMLEQDMILEQRQKSAVIRIPSKPLRVTKGLAAQEAEARAGLDAALRLSAFFVQHRDALTQVPHG